jgi:hypothetical protein
MSARSANLLRVAFSVCDARCTLVQLRFSTETAAARDGFQSVPVVRPILANKIAPNVNFCRYNREIFQPEFFISRRRSIQ